MRVRDLEGLISRLIFDENSGCWVWQGTTNRNGYGRFRRNKKTVLVHREVYEQFFGAVPEGLIVMHSCDNPPCCSPGHLIAGTHKDNARDRDDRGRAIFLYGESHGRAKATIEVVEDIRSSEDTLRALAKKHGLSKSQVHRIRNGDHWRKNGKGKTAQDILGPS